MKTVRASEIGAYLYCQRAWWYQKHGLPTANQPELAAGAELHENHGRAVFLGGCLRSLAYLLLLGAIVFGTIALLQGVI